MILGANNIKMGKRYPEFVVDPADVCRDFGADTLRIYEMFMGPLEASKPWSTQGVEGARRFLDRVYRIIIENNIVTKEAVPELDLIYHQTVKKVSEDFENLAFNTAISQMMIFINEVYRVNKISQEYAEGFVKMISCICPHLGEEMWEKLGHNKTIAFEPWPKYDESKLAVNTIKIAVQVNGKLRGELNVPVDESEENLKAQALELDGVKRNIEGKEIKKIIVVKGRIINIVDI
jgi:leucyl-tRNA synthetase